MGAAQATPATLGFVEVTAAAVWPLPTPGTEIELQRADGARLRIENTRATVPHRSPSADVSGDRVMLQLTPQSRIFVAMEPVDFRKGTDGLAAVVPPGAQRQSPQRRPLCAPATARAPRSKSCCYDGQGFWLCTKRLSHRGTFPLVA